jgi:hypothetical protein
MSCWQDPRGQSPNRQTGDVASAYSRARYHRHGGWLARPVYVAAHVKRVRMKPTVLLGNPAGACFPVGSEKRPIASDATEPWSDRALYVGTNGLRVRGYDVCPTERRRQVGKRKQASEESADRSRLGEFIMRHAVPVEL